MEQYFRGIDPKSQVDIYESWIATVSKELLNEGLLEQAYKPLSVDEMSFVEIVDRASYYLEND